MEKKTLKPEGQKLREVVYRLNESFASMGHSSLWKLICAISVCNTLPVGVHLSSTHSISGPGSATGQRDGGNSRALSRGACVCMNEFLVVGSCS